MKSIRLPETDVANLAFRTQDFKATFLANWLRPKKIPGTYEPLRRSVGEAANVALPLLPDIPTTTLEQLERLVLRECKGNSKLAEMNLAPVRAIRRFVEEKGAVATFLEDLPITLYPGMRYSFWVPMLVHYDGQVRIVFFDLRKTGGLAEAGLHVCFSLMHERFRALNPDYAEVRFESWKFSTNPDRRIKVISEWCDPIGFDSIRADVVETYKILDALRRGSAGPATGTDDGPLFR